MDDGIKILLGILGIGGAYLALSSKTITPDPLPTWRPGAVPRLSDAKLARIAYDAGWRGDNLVTAIAVAIAESGGYPDASAWNRMKNGRVNHDRGLWQISSAFHPNFPDADAFDPRKNAAYAFRLWTRNGWGPWIVHGSETYKQFLTRARSAAAIVEPGGIV